MSSKSYNSGQFANSTSASRSRARYATPSSAGSSRQLPPSPEVNDIQHATLAIRNHDKKLEDDADLGVVDRNTFVTGVNTGRVPPAEKRSAPFTANPDLLEVHQAMSLIADNFVIPAVRHSETSWYLPSCIIMFEILAVMDDLLSTSRNLLFSEPNYFSLPVRVYYSVLYYVQIMRAKMAANFASASERSWFRTFEGMFPFSSLPVPGPLVAYFTNLVACPPDSDLYGYVTPSNPTRGTYSTINKVTDTEYSQQLIVDPTHFLVPCLPLLVSMLRQFCNAPEITDEMFDKFGQYIPVPISGKTENSFLAGVAFPPHLLNEKNPSIAALLNNPAISHPFIDDEDSLTSCHTFWQNSACRLIPDISYTHNYQANTISEITMIGERSQWFSLCISMAAHHSKFFTDGCTLDRIPVHGGSASLAVTTIDIMKHRAIPDVANFWYPDSFSSLQVSIVSYNSVFLLGQQRLAAHALTNSVYNWVDNSGKRIGSYDATYRAGPYFKDRLPVYKSQAPTTMPKNLRTTIQSDFFDSHAQTK